MCRYKGSHVGYVCRDRSHPDALGQSLEDERVFAPDQFGELFFGVAERFDRENGEIEDGRRQLMVPLAEVPDDDEVDITPFVEVTVGKRPIQDDGGDASVCPDRLCEIPDLLDN